MIGIDSQRHDTPAGATRHTELVTGDRLRPILAQLRAGGDITAGVGRVCEVSADVTATSGAGIMLLSGDLPQGSLGTTDKVSELIEDLQYTLGEGPSVDAHKYGKAVLEPNLAAPSVPRWPGFAAPAAEAGVRAVFGFPIRTGAARLGALNLYRDRPGYLSDDQFTDALIMADLAANAILAMQADASPGTVAAELEVGANFQFAVHQAAGMVSVQLGVSVGDALIRLRSYAFCTDRRVGEVAHDVVSRRLRFDERRYDERASE